MTHLRIDLDVRWLGDLGALLSMSVGCADDVATDVAENGERWRDGDRGRLATGR